MENAIDLSQLKKIQLEIMDFFDKWCRSQGIVYYITAGTLIGALRHKGFIPWDDDIDVVMLRKDYDLLMEKFPKCNTGDYRLFAFETDKDCIYPYAKVYDSSTVLIEGDERVSPKIGVNIDIFPLDNATNDYQNAVRMKKRIKPLNDILGIKLLDNINRGFKKNIMVWALRCVAAPFPFPWLIKRIINKSKDYITEDESKYVVNSVIYAKGEREILERKWFKETIELEFEGRSYLAPIGADQYMKRLFGDYLTLPPENQRISHHRFHAYYK